MRQAYIFFPLLLLRSLLLGQSTNSLLTRSCSSVLEILALSHESKAAFSFLCLSIILSSSCFKMSSSRRLRLFNCKLRLRAFDLQIFYIFSFLIFAPFLLVFIVFLQLRLFFQSRSVKYFCFSLPVHTLHLGASCVAGPALPSFSI